VVAITPFNHPALLVLHKLAPALAAGNAVVLEPATSTPLTALELAECFVDAGLPEGVLSVLVGSGAVLGDATATWTAPPWGSSATAVSAAGERS
jgi:glyceraldehyde-3-phosphate dehydrogenase (NADP+)